ncbi:MAG: hypothetical protein IKB98_04470 [Clostridia bacterium]|nr:hypothetical protein [Clostridia bacterium]
MEKYERITDKRLQIGRFYAPKSKEERLELVDSINKQLTYENIYTRLAELEDKLENGTLVDTKVKIGQRVFRRGFFKGEIDEYIVSNIILENGKLKFHLKHDYDEHQTCYSATVLDIEEIGKTVFLTKAEAEKKVKEQQNEKK